MKDQIIDIIINLTGYEDLRNNLNINLVEEDILDSLAFIELITQLEDTFDIEIQPTQLPSNTWESVENIFEMVKKQIKK